MKDLSQIIGLPVCLEGSELRFGAGVVCEESLVRTGAEMRDVLQDPDAPVPEIAYRMYRGVSLEQDREALKEAGLRFDLTVIPAGRFGLEVPKTYGHFHNKPAGSQLAYPELYFVVSGRAIFQLQEGASLSFLVLAKEGDAVRLPPGYGHVTHNAGGEPLVLADIIARDCQGDYRLYKLMHGAAMYLLDTGGGVPCPVGNPHYGFAATPGLVSPDPEHSVRRILLDLELPLYTNLVRAPARYEWLVKPQVYRNYFAGLPWFVPDFDRSWVAKDLEQIANSIPAPRMGFLAEVILESGRIIGTGQGRSGLVVRAFIMRLAQLGLTAYCVGESNTPRIVAGDLLVACSGSGETATTLHHARVARETGALVAAVTRNRASSLAALSDVTVELPVREEESPQLGRTLFEQAAFIALDALVTHLARKLGLTTEDLLKRHANLE